jgi:hypothetical protein
VRTVDHDADGEVGQCRFERLPERVRDAMGDLAGAAKEGLLALSVGGGLGVLHELMEAELDVPRGAGGLRPAARRRSRRGGGRRKRIDALPAPPEDPIGGEGVAIWG